jgi:hypothetical protein
VTEQAVDRRFFCRIEGEIRVLDIARDQTAALERSAESFGEPLYQGAQLLWGRCGQGVL